MDESDGIEVLDMHTGGEPVRIVLKGYPEIPGATILDKRRYARDHLDHLRRIVIHEPRGHDDMYGVVPVAPDLPGADLAVLFLTNDGYSTMCGHAVIALGRWAVESGLVAPREPETQVAIQCPCGLVTATVAVRNGRAGAVTFESVPAFAVAIDRDIEVPGLGHVTVDVGYGGAFYVLVPAARARLDVSRSAVRDLVEVGDAIARAAERQIPLDHPDGGDLAFYYGTILTDGGDGAARPSTNVCVFADRQVDRSATGSGVTARLAVEHARGRARPGAEYRFRSLTGDVFTGRIGRSSTAGAREAVTVLVGGRAYYTGRAQFTVEPDDPLGGGFRLN